MDTLPRMSDLGNLANGTTLGSRRLVKGADACAQSRESSLAKSVA
jgi:hypothetical protein